LGIQVSYGVEQAHLISEHPTVVLIERTTPSAIGHLYSELVCKAKRSVEVVREDTKRQANQIGPGSCDISDPAMHLEVVNCGIIGKHEALQEIEVPLGDPRNAKLAETPWQNHVQSDRNPITEGLASGELDREGLRRLHLRARSVQSRSLPWSRLA
jgi:hypothetical protein